MLLLPENYSTRTPSERYKNESESRVIGTQSRSLCEVGLIPRLALVFEIVLGKFDTSAVLDRFRGWRPKKLSLVTGLRPTLVERKTRHKTNKIADTSAYPGKSK